MAVSYTPEQYKNVKSVADKMGSGNENFKAALNKKYGEGAYDSFISYKAPATSGTNMQGQVDAQTPANAQSLGNVKINTEAMKQYNPNYNPNVGAGVSGVTGTPSKPVISASVTPIGQQTTEGAKTAPVQPQPQAKTDLNVPTQPVSTPQDITPPTQVEKTTTITPEGQTVVKKETPGVVTPDYNVGKGREQEILTNLNTDLQSNEKVKQALATGDYETFKQNYGYDTADQTKKQMLDAFFQTQQPKNSESFFQTLTQGMKIENSKYRESPEARDAQHRFDIISPYKGASVDSIYNGMVNKIIPPGSKAYKDLLTANGGIETPEMLEAKKKLETKQRIDKINEEGARQNADSTGTTYAEKPDTTQVISDNIVSKKGFDYAQRYKEKVSQDPETRELAEQIKTDTLRKKEIERIRSDIFKNIIKEHPGITKGAANLLAKRETEGYDDEYNNLIDTLNVNSADLRYKTSLLEKEFDYEVKQAQTEEERAYQAQQQEQQFAKQKELAQFQQELGLKGDQAKFEQQMKQKAQIASDPVMATQDVLDTYAKLGILPERSNQEIIQSVQNDIASGMTLGQSLTNLNKAFQSKDQYKEIIKSKEKTQPQVWTKLDDKTLFNQATGETKSVSSLTTGASATDLLSVPDGTVIPSRLSETTNPNKGKECAEYINDIAGLGMGDTYASKIAKTNTQVHEEASVGNIAVWNPNPNDPKWNKYGHAGVIVGEEGDSWLIKSSNLKGDGAISTDKIPKKSIYSYNTEKKVSIPQAGGEVMGSAGVPLSYQRRIEQMIPVQLRNSDAESKKLMADIKNMQQAGLSPEDATLMYLGFNVTDKNSKAEAMKLVGQARGLGESLPEDFFIKLSDYVNNGNIAGAKSFTDRVVEGTIKKQVGEDFVSTPNLKFAESTLSRVENLINRNKDKIGPLSGRIADVEKTLINDPDYQALKTLLSGSLADTRRAFGGTAVSQSELQALKDFIGLNTNMPIENLLSGLRTNLATLQDKYQQQRGFYLGEEAPAQAPVKTTGTPKYQDFYN